MLGPDFAALETTPPTQSPKTSCKSVSIPEIESPSLSETSSAWRQANTAIQTRFGPQTAFLGKFGTFPALKRCIPPEKHGFVHLGPFRGKTGQTWFGEGSEKGRGRAEKGRRRVGEGSEKGRRRVGEGSAPFSAAFAPFLVIFLRAAGFLQQKGAGCSRFSSAPRDTVAILARPPARS